MSAKETLVQIEQHLGELPPEVRAQIEAAAKQIRDIVGPLGEVGVFAVALVGATIEQMIEEGQL